MSAERPLTPFTAAELAMDRALASDKVAGAQKLEAILGGNGEWTAEVAYKRWQDEMVTLGFGEYAVEPELPMDPTGVDCPERWEGIDA